jgi:hypothetical protein
MSEPVTAVQVIHDYVQTIKATPEVVFPLLCPVREAEWLPGWEARMVHSRSGVAEPGCVFATAHDLGETVWFMAEHVPASRVRFVRFEPDGVLVDIDLKLVADGPLHTSVQVRYAFTATRGSADAAVRARTGAAWQAMMQRWERQMNRFLREAAAA